MAVRRVALAGAGWVAPHHLKAWHKLRDRAFVVAIADPNVELARERAGAFGVPAAYASVEEMLDRERLDVLDVASTRETHASNCLLAADRGISILCQKPLAPTLAEGEALIAAVGNRVRLMVHENWRFRPHYRRVGEWLRDGFIGEIRAVTMALLTSGLIPDASGRAPAIERQPVFATLDRLLVMEVLIHHIDTLRFLLGPLALADASIGRRSSLVRGEDHASISMTTDAGAPVSLVGDLMAPGHPAAQRDRLEIIGSTGTILLEADRLHINRGVEIEADVAIDLDANYAESYLAAITHYLDRLDDGEPFETSPQDNLQTLQIVEAVYREAERVQREPRA